MYTINEAKLTFSPIIAGSKLPKITEATDAHALLLKNWDPGLIDFVESFYVLLLNRNNRLLGIFEASRGGIAGTVVDARLVFIAALKACATSIIVAHNHPSGNLTPSESDLNLTRNLVNGGRILDIPVVDHLIVTNDSFFSFADAGLI